MPIYEFVCEACGNEYEKIVPFSAEGHPPCPVCLSTEVKRRVGMPAIHFKGSGWYINDSKKNGSGKKSETNGSGEKSTDKDSSKESKSSDTSAKSSDTSSDASSSSSASSSSQSSSSSSDSGEK